MDCLSEGAQRLQRRPRLRVARCAWMLDSRGARMQMDLGYARACYTVETAGGASCTKQPARLEGLD